MSSILSKINIVSKFLKLLYGDYWLKFQGAIFFKTFIPFVFWGVLYLWYRSVGNALIALNMGFLPVKPWAFIVEWSYFLFLVFIVIAVFAFYECLMTVFHVRSKEEMLNDLETEAKKLFEIQEKMEDLSRSMRLSLLKVVAKYAIIFFFRLTRYLVLLSVPFMIIALVGFLLGAIIHLEILFWVYTNYKDVTILGIAPFSLFEMTREYLLHPLMAIFYILPFSFLIGSSETISSNLRRRMKRSPMYGLFVSLSATNVLYRIARACSVTFRCVTEDVRQTSLEVIILSRRDLHRAIMKNIGGDQKVCIVTLHMQMLDELKEEEKEELKKFFKELVPKIFKKGKIGEITASLMEKQAKRATRELKKVEGHAIFALVKEGCKFCATGQKVFALSVKYIIWCEDPFVKDKIIAVAGK